MIKIIDKRDEGAIIRYSYAWSELFNKVMQRTAAVANVMVTADGADSFDVMSATADNTIELQGYAEEAWRNVVSITRRYHYTAPCCCMHDEVKEYAIELAHPMNWDQTCALPLDGSIDNYLVSAITRRWWLSRGHGDQVAVEAERIEAAEKEIRYSLNARERYGRAARWI